jgi:hypothetical protein
MEYDCGVGVCPVWIWATIEVASLYVLVIEFSFAITYVDRRE